MNEFIADFVFEIWIFVNLHLCTFLDPAQEMEDEGTGRRKRNTLLPPQKMKDCELFFTPSLVGRVRRPKKGGVGWLEKEKKHTPLIFRVCFFVFKAERENKFAMKRLEGESSPTSFFLLARFPLVEETGFRQNGSSLVNKRMEKLTLLGQSFANFFF